MKKQTTKRALAGVLAVLTVAGSAPANVGGLILAANSIVASAAEVADQSMTLDANGGTPLYKFITEYKNGTRNLDASAIASTSATTFAFTPYQDTTIKSTVPLNFNATSATGAAVYLSDGEIPAGYGYDATAKFYDSTKVADRASGITLTKDNKTYKGYYDATAGAQTGTTTEAFLDSSDAETTDFDKAVKYRNSGGEVFAIIFKATDDELATINSYYYKKVSQDDVVDAAAEAFAGEDATNDYLEALTDTKGYEVDATDGKIKFNLADFKEEYKNGVYTYTFMAPQFPLTVSSTKTTIAVTEGLALNGTWGPNTNKVEAKDKAIDGVAVTIKNAAGDTVYTAQNATQNAFVNEDLKVVSDVAGNAGYFKLYVWNGNLQTNYKTYEPNLNNDGKYEITIKACDVAQDGADNWQTNIFVQKATPSYSFELSSDKTTLTAKGNGINKAAAQITAESFTKDKDGNYAAKGTELKSDSDAVENGGRVVLDLTALKEYTLQETKESSIIITRNGKELADSTNIGAGTYGQLKDTILNGTENSGKYTRQITLEGAGEYSVEFYVWVHETTDTTDSNIKKKLTFNFEIAKLSELTAKNVKLTCTNFNELKDTDGTILKSEEPKLIDGVYVFELKQGKELKNKTVTIDAELFTDTAKKNAFGNKNQTDAARYYTVTGATEVTSTDKVQTIVVSYYDPEFSKDVQKIEMKWKVAEAEPVVQIVRAKAEAEHLTGTNGNTPDANFTFDDVNWDAEDVESREWKPTRINTSIDEIADLEELVKDSYIVVNGDEKNVSYKYVEGAGVLLANAEMDTEYEGLPSEVGQYSVYLLYNGEAKQIVDVYISEHSLYAAPTDEQLNLTYGTELFDETTLAYVDANGNAVKDIKVSAPTIRASKLVKLSVKESQKVRDGKTDYGYGYEVYNIDGEWYEETGTVYSNLSSYALMNLDNIYLNAGNYLVTVEQNPAKTKIDQEGYSLSTQEFIVKVAKKKITKDMILIDPMTYTKKSQTITSTNINGTDIDLDKDRKANNSVSLKIASGNATGTDIGGYDIVVTVVDNENNANAAMNYEGEVKMQWFIVPNAKDQNQADFEWNDGKTTIVDNGNIRAFVKRPANTSYSKDIAEYGLLYEKDGKLAAPKFGQTTENGSYNVGGKAYTHHTDAYVAAKVNGGYYTCNSGEVINAGVTDTQVRAAYTALQYGNGIVGKVNYEGSTAMSRQELSTKIRVTNVDTGVWVRPYVLLDNGDIYYGEVRYINLVDEATDILGLKTAVAGGPESDSDVAQTAKSAADVKAKASKKELSSKAWRDKVRAGFDETTGKYFVFSSYTIKEGSEVKETAVQRFGFVVDKNAKVNSKNVAKNLKADSGFAQGLAKKGNANYDDDEVGAKIIPANSVNDIWYRTFVDFGNGLIVYTDAVQLNSVSSQFAAVCKPTVTPSKSATTGKIEMKVPAADLKASDVFKAEEATLKYVGMVADNKGTYTALNDAKTNYLFASQDAYKAMVSELIAENAKTNGYSVKRNAQTDTTIDFKAYITPEYDAAGRQIPVAYRPFVVYVINGNEITIYGDAVAYNGTGTDGLAHGAAADFADGKYEP